MKTKSFLSMNNRLTRTVLIALMMTLSAFAGMVKAQTAATVTTDKADYMPYEIVNITGWQPGETVTLVIDETFLTAPGTDIYSTDVIAGADGSISYSDYIIENEDLGESFKLTATGQSSGLSAVTNFTDSSKPTTTVVTSSPAPSASGQSVTFTATITSNGTINCGTVVFTIDGLQNNATTFSGGIATYSTSILAIELHTITAAFTPAGGCNYDPSSSANYTHTVTGCIAPNVPTISNSSATICSVGSSTLSITLGNLGSATAWQWYSGSCGGISVGSGTSVTVSPVSTTTYYVRGEGGCVTSGSCASVTVNATPAVPSASAQAFCSAANPTVASLVASGANLKWYDVATNGSALVGTTALSTGTYYVSQTSAQGCESARTAVGVTVNTTPNAPSAVNYSGAYDGTAHTGSATVGAGETVDWYAASTGGTLITAPSGTNVGNYSAYAEARNTTFGCKSTSRTLVNVTISKAASTVSVTGGAFTYTGTAHAATGFAYGVGGSSDVLAPAVTFNYVGTPNGALTDSYSSSTAPTLAGS
jgi:hypothetical protein